MPYFSTMKQKKRFLLTNMKQFFQLINTAKSATISVQPICSVRPRPHYTVFKRKRYCFVPGTATVHTLTLKTITENGSLRKRSPEWSDLKTVLFENAVFLVWTAKTMPSENDDVTTTTPPGCRPLNREYTR